MIKLDNVRSFTTEHNALLNKLYHAEAVSTAKWQGIDVSTKPEMTMHVVYNHSLQFPMKTDELDYHRRIIKPNLPWADDHFEERVGGEPLNPGREWEHWPYAKSADTFRDDNGQFNHNYMERYWPKYAGMTDKGEDIDEYMERLVPHKGIRYDYGDLSDVVDLLLREPGTRQAYLPVWFPEDTGSHEGRRPCTLGYLFQLEKRKLNVVYYIRSCDFIRHFRDDVYLTVRLCLWVLNMLRMQDPSWKEVVPGEFVMHIANLHIFRNDRKMLFGEN